MIMVFYMEDIKKLVETLSTIKEQPVEGVNVLYQDAYNMLKHAGIEKCATYFIELSRNKSVKK